MTGRVNPGAARVTECDLIRPGGRRDRSAGHRSVGVIGGSSGGGHAFIVLRECPRVLAACGLAAGERR